MQTSAVRRATIAILATLVLGQTSGQSSTPDSDPSSVTGLRPEQPGQENASPPMSAFDSGVRNAPGFTDLFSKVTEGDPVTDGACSHGVSCVDYDGDGDFDLFVTNWWYSGWQTNRLYINDGVAGFTESTGTVLTSSGNCLNSTWGDFDNDGDIDGYVLNPGSGPVGGANYLYRNEGGGNYTVMSGGVETTDAAVTTGGSFADLDRDGNLDLLVGSHATLDTLGAFYYRGDGHEFVRLADTAMGLEHCDISGLCFGDGDCDGILDLVHFRNAATARYYHGQADGSFTGLANVVSSDSSKAFAWGDYDNDGDLDLCGGSYHNPGLVLYTNDGAGNFTRTAIDPSDTSTGSTPRPYWVDYDNDGDLDIHCTKMGFGYTAHPNTLYENNGDGTFSRVETGALVSDTSAATGAAWADFDGDGDLDVYVTNTASTDNEMFINLGNANSWIGVDCEGTVSNRSAIGAVVRVKMTVEDSGVWQMRQVMSQSGSGVQSPLQVHFGLGSAESVDSLVVEWPSGVRQVLTEIPGRQVITITEACCGYYGAGFTGNANCSLDGKMTLSDISILIDRVYISKADLCCEAAGNTNGSPDGLITLSDISRLIDKIYISKAPTEPCL